MLLREPASATRPEALTRDRACHYGPRMGRRRSRLAAVAAVGLVVLVTCTVLAVHAHTTAFGWFAYAPLSEQSRLPRVVSDRELVAWAGAVLGLVLLAGCLGYALGSRPADGRARRADR